MASTLFLAVAGLALGASAQAPNSYLVVGNTGASAQQMFLTTERTVQIVDKTERNGVSPFICSQSGAVVLTPLLNVSFVIGNPSHFAWSSEYDLVTNTATERDVVTNSFCAGGAVMGNGTWINVGGNQAVGALGNSVAPGTGPYDDDSGSRTVRLLDYCDPNSEQYCNQDWREWNGMPTNRWYPSLETLADGTVMVIGGELWGGYVDDADQNQMAPNYEFIGNPAVEGQIIPMQFLTDTAPLNLFPPTWLLPSGLILMQAGNSAQLYDVVTQQETPLPNIPGGQRAYPASAGVTALPMTPENGYNLTAIFCGGLNVDLQTAYNPTAYDVTQYQGVTSCQTITPDVNPTWVGTDDLLQGTVMLNLINLPDGRVFGLNGCGQGTAGYGWQNFGNGQGYGKVPRLMPAGYYNHSAPAGQRWSNTGISPSVVPRMYHSSATLLPDASIFVGGSNPSADFVGVDSAGVDYNATDPFHTEYRAERFYPDYYFKPRPLPSNLPTNINYGGANFNITLPKENVTSQADLDNTKVVLIRTGFSTHAINFGQRHVELPTSYTWNTDGSATINVGQLPPNANILAPGPLLFFVVMNGVPSVAKFVMVGNGQVGTQPTAPAVPLPANNLAFLEQQTSSAGSAAATGAVSPGAGAVSGSTGSHAAGSQTNYAAIGGGIAAGVVAAAAVAAVVLICVRRRRRAQKPASRGVYQPASYREVPNLGYATRPHSAYSSQQDLLASPNKRPAYGSPQRSTSTLDTYKSAVARSQQDLLGSQRYR